MVPRGGTNRLPFLVMPTDILTDSTSDDNPKSQFPLPILLLTIFTYQGAISCHKSRSLWQGRSSSLKNFFYRITPFPPLSSRLHRATNFQAVRERYSSINASSIVTGREKYAHMSAMLLAESPVKGGTYFLAFLSRNCFLYVM